MTEAELIGDAILDSNNQLSRIEEEEDYIVFKQYFSLKIITLSGSFPFSCARSREVHGVLDRQAEHGITLGKCNSTVSLCPATVSHCCPSLFYKHHYYNLSCKMKVFHFDF